MPEENSPNKNIEAPISPTFQKDPTPQQTPQTPSTPTPVSPTNPTPTAPATPQQTSSNYSNPNATSDNQFKRGIAYKLRIGEILVGKPFIDPSTQRFNFLELGDKKVTRVNAIGNIVDKYENPGEKNYIFFTLDDGSGQLKVRAFGDDADKFKDVNQGQTVVVIGKLRQFNDEVYVTPEIIKEKDPKYLLVRKKETEKEKSEAVGPVEKSQVTAIKDKILDLIKKSEDQGGIDIDQIIMSQELTEGSPEIINQEVKKMIEEGIIFEPRPGKLRWLG